MICPFHQVPMRVAKRDRRGWSVRRCPECIAEDRAKLAAVKKLFTLHSRRWPAEMRRQGRSIPILQWER